MAAPRFQLSDRRLFTLREALAVTVVAAVVPGVAQLRAGRRRFAAVLVGVYAALVVIASLTPAVPTVGPAVIAVAWVTLVLLSYRAVRPTCLAFPARVAAGAAVATLCAIVTALPLMLARPGDHVVANRVTPRVASSSVPSAAPSSRPARPGTGWDGSRRLNVLLVARDAGRTTGMTLASVDPRTGATVLLRLPAGLHHVPVPGLPRSTTLRSVYGYGLAHPRLAGERVANPGAELLKRAAGRVVGMPVDYYRVVGVRDMRRLSAAAHRRHGCGRRPALLPGRDRSIRGGGQDEAATDVPRRLPPSLAGLRGKTRKARISAVRLDIRPAAGRTVPRADYHYLRDAAARAVHTAPGTHAPHSSAAGGPAARDVCR